MTSRLFDKVAVNRISKFQFFFNLFIIHSVFLIMLTGCDLRSEKKPESGSKVNLPHGEGDIGIICKSKTRAMTSEGQKRALLLELKGKEPVFFRYPETFAGEKTKISVCWYSENSVLRFKDTMAKYHILNAEHECVLDLETRDLKYVVRDPNGPVYVATISEPCKKMPIGFSSGKDNNVFPNLDIAVTSPYDPVIEGKEASISEEAWTRNEGIFLGFLTCD